MVTGAEFSDQRSEQRLRGAEEPADCDDARGCGLESVHGAASGRHGVERIGACFGKHLAGGRQHERAPLLAGERGGDPALQCGKLLRHGRG